MSKIGCFNQERRIRPHKIGQDRHELDGIPGWQIAGRPPTCEQIMIEDRIQKIEARLKESANIPEAKKAELLDLLAL